MKFPMNFIQKVALNLSSIAGLLLVLNSKISYKNISVNFTLLSAKIPWSLQHTNAIFILSTNRDFWIIMLYDYTQIMSCRTKIRFKISLATRITYMMWMNCFLSFRGEVLLNKTKRSVADYMCVVWQKNDLAWKETVLI